MHNVELEDGQACHMEMGGFFSAQLSGATNHIVCSILCSVAPVLFFTFSSYDF